MANWVRRQPQGPECAINPQAPGCESSDETSQVAEPTTQVQAGNTEAATLIATATSAVSENAATVVTMISTNLNGRVWTSSYTSIQTEVPTADRTTRVFISSTTNPSVQPNPPTSARPVRDNYGVSKGAVAGIAVGTFIVGAALMFVATWLLFKRRDKKFIQKTCPSGYPIYADSSPELVMVQKSAASGSPYVQVSQTQMRTPVPVPARLPAPSPQGTKDALAGILPPAASEHDVGTRISALFKQVHHHIDTYYRDVHASITPSMDSDLASFGKDMDMLELLQNCSRPTVALKHALIAFVLTIIGPKQDGGDSTLWPAELATLLKPQDSGKSSLP